MAFVLARSLKQLFAFIKTSSAQLEHWESRFVDRDQSKEFIPLLRSNRIRNFPSHLHQLSRALRSHAIIVICAENANFGKPRVQNVRMISIYSIELLSFGGFSSRIFGSKHSRTSQQCLLELSVERSLPPDSLSAHCSPPPLSISIRRNSLYRGLQIKRKFNGESSLSRDRIIRYLFQSLLRLPSRSR